jgi:cell division transport system ATP-binding protein
MGTSKNNAPMIELIKVAKSYPPNVDALIDISLTVQRGELVFLTGKSGAGKTTLLRLLSRIEKPTRGLVEVDGRDIGKLSQGKLQKLRRRIGFIFQDFKLLPNRTVAQNVAVSMEVSYTRPRLMRRRIKELLEQLGLEDKYATPTSELSRGEQQRVAIARAAAAKPDLILADEPTGNLDLETTRQVMELFLQCNEKGATLLIATHDPAIYQKDKQRIVALSHGRQVNGIDETSSATKNEQETITIQDNPPKSEQVEQQEEVTVTTEEGGLSPQEEEPPRSEEAK